MAYVQREPQPLLTDFVKCLWAVEREYRPPLTAFDVLPDSYLELIFNCGVPCRYDDGAGARPVPDCYVVGLLDKPFQVLAAGTVRLIGARLFAWAYPALFGAEAQPPNGVRALDGSWHPLAARLAALNNEAGVELLDCYLGERMTAARPQSGSLRAAAQLLQRENGQARVADLADRAHLSRRQLERNFNAAAGVSPKQLARKIRFEQVRDQLWREPDADLAALAAQHGYADQAHLTREFKRFSRQTPRQFAEAARRRRALLGAGGAAFV